MAKNIWDSNSSQKGAEPVDDADHRDDNSMMIVVYNLLALVGYTVICVIFREIGAILDAVFIGVHFFTCFILTVINGKRVWILSGLLVLLIGFSTCVGVLWKLM